MATQLCASYEQEIMRQHELGVNMQQRILNWNHFTGSPESYHLEEIIGCSMQKYNNHISNFGFHVGLLNPESLNKELKKFKTKMLCFKP